MATDDQSNPRPVRASERDWKRIADGWAWSPPCCCLLELRDRVAALEAAAQLAAAPEPDPDQILASMNAIYEKLSPAEPAPQTQQGVTVDELVDCFPNPFNGDLESFAQLLLDHPRIGPLLQGKGAAVPAGGWSGVAVDCLPPISPAVWVGTPADVAPQVVPTTSTVLTVDELADCLPANAWAGPEGYSRQAFARHLLDHPRIGPLLRGEGAAAPKRVALAEDPPEADTPRCWRRIDGPYKTAWQEGYAAGWAAARTEVERQQQGGQADG